MELTELIRHPERMDRDTLYELRSMLALYPYFQTARLLMLQNLYLLHDASFDEELRRAAVYITDRKVIFQMIEAAHYQLHQQPQPTGTSSARREAQSPAGRTIDLIDSFLDAIPDDEELTQEPQRKPKRRPTPADAAVDYVAYLLATESAADADAQQPQQDTPQLKGQSLIDHFLEEDGGRILLGDLAADADEPQEQEESAAIEEEYFTETLARIYIRQGRYQKALDIIARLSRQHPEKNIYFADQMRFLEKLIINKKQETRNNKQ